MKRCRRPLILVAFLLLAGAVVNAAVAWDSAARQLPKSGLYGWDLAPADRFDEPSIAWGAVNGLRADRRYWFTQYHGASYLPVVLMLGIDLTKSSERPAEDFIAQWGSLFSAGGAVRFDLSKGTEQRHGWPLRSFWGAILWDSENGRQRPTCALVLGDRKPRLVQTRYLPLKPLPIGFAINTLFYALVVGAILALPLSIFPLRRRLRARRGRCPKCGYDRTGLAESTAPCPECGAAPPTTAA